MVTQTKKQQPGFSCAPSIQERSLRVLLIDAEMSGARQLGTKWAHHPLGLMYLAAYARQAFAGSEFKIFHTAVVPNPDTALQELLASWRPNIVGIRSLSVAQEAFRKYATLARATLPDCLLIGGGPFPSSAFRDVLKDGMVDLVVIGEGEDALVEIISRYLEGVSVPSDVAGTAVQRDGVLQVNPHRPLATDLDRLPFPAYDLISLADYRSFSNHSFQDCSRSAFLFATRGCPYSCCYCHQLFGKRIRRRSAESILAEMKDHVDKRGICDFVFVDDVFNVPLDSAKQVLRLIARDLPDVHLNFPNGMRADQVDDELLDLLQACHTRHIAFAIETAVPRLQTLAGKRLRIEAAREAIRKASQRFMACCFFMIGFPSETLAEAKQTIDFAADLDFLVQPVLSIVRVQKETPLFHILTPTETQAQKLQTQEAQINEPGLMEKHEFWGDYFSREQSPLTSREIQALRLDWFQRVQSNPRRIKNAHAILSRFLDDTETLRFYRNYFDSPNLSLENIRAIASRAGG
jgi:anaerobic magnesium-protoporphyrin IX monomethyl ester cyclase